MYFNIFVQSLIKITNGVQSYAIDVTIISYFQVLGKMTSTFQPSFIIVLKKPPAFYLILEFGSVKKKWCTKIKVPIITEG